MADQVKVRLYGDLLRKRSGLFRAKKFKESATAFEQASLVDPKDSIALQYAASISMQGELYERAVKNYKKLVLVTPKVTTYQSIIAIQLAVLNDNYYKDMVESGETNSTKLSNAFAAAAGGYMTAIQFNKNNLTTKLQFSYALHR